MPAPLEQLFAPSAQPEQENILTGPQTYPPLPTTWGTDNLSSHHTIGVVLPARDEGSEVLATIASAREMGADSIAVVDDGSRDDSCNPRVLPADVRLIRHNSPAGPAACRNEGAQAVDADTVVFADAHVRFGDLRRAAALAHKYRAIVCACIRSLNGKRRWTGYGGVFREEPSCLDVLYRKRNAGQVDRAYALIGAIYAMPRSVFHHLGGWLRTVSWGYNEQALSLKAFFADVPILVDRSFICYHLFKRQFNYAVHTSATHINRFIVHRVVFDDETYRNYWLPRFAAYRHAYARGLAMAESDRVLAERDAFRRVKVRADADFFAEAVGRGGFRALREKDAPR